MSALELIEIQNRIQSQWHESRIFEVDEPPCATDKYMGTFPFPYTNGLMHLGHAFTLTKVDFQCHFQRLLGKHVIFPFAFHGTGMPISAAARRLHDEISQYGNPPTFPDGAPPTSDDPKVKQSAKVVSKAEVGVVYQWDILAKMGIADADIPHFQDPKHWLRYFPDLARRDLKALGVGVDWRRSFMTTDLNPHFDSFVRWQVETLREAGKITFGRRLAIFSPVTKQVTADHDRSVGEGVDVKTSRLIMLTLQAPYADEIAAFVPDEFHGTVVIPATFEGDRVELIPELTHVWASPNMSYSLFQGMHDHDQLFLCSEQSMQNMVFQDFTAVRGQVHKLGEVPGTVLFSSHLCRPSLFEEETSKRISPNTTVPIWPWVWTADLPGTGIIPAIPSDVLSDAAAYREIMQKPALQVKFGFDANDGVIAGDIVEGISYKLVEACNVVSPKDTTNLEKAAAMLPPVNAAQLARRLKVEHHLTATNQLHTYGEPASRVVSRAGHKCCVAKCDQWLLTYGEPVWKEQVREHIQERVETHNPQTKRDLLQTLDWLKEWGLSRSLGEGTRVPWDEQYVIESLSDSTIYMAFYTVCHLLTQYDVPASVLTRNVWDYVMDRASSLALPDEVSGFRLILERMRSEFRFWYPVNLRVSGKDLIGNHLVMSLYHHAAIWPEQTNYWPQCIFANGHIMVDGEKMSKAKGNFITIADAVATYSSDVTRFALASSGDGLENANFVRGTAIESILTKIVAELAFARHVVTLLASDSDVATNDNVDATFFDNVFRVQMDVCAVRCKEAYERLQYREVIKYAFLLMVSHRNQYRSMLQALGCNPDRNPLLLRLYVERVCIMLAPICPHWSQEIWANVLSRGGFVHTDARWPSDNTVMKQNLDHDVEQMEFLVSSMALIQKSFEGQWQAYKKRTKQPNLKAPTQPPTLTLWISEGFLDWHKQVVRVMQDVFSKVSTPDFRQILAQLRTQVPGNKAQVEAAASFAKSIYDDVLERGPAVALQLPADDYWRQEEAILRRFHTIVLRNTPHIQDATRLAIQIQRHVDDEARGKAGIKRAYPGQIACAWLFQ